MAENNTGDIEKLGTQEMLNFFNRIEAEISGNAFQDYLIAAGITAVLLLFVIAMRGLLRKRLTVWISARGRNTDVKMVSGVIKALFSLLMIVPFYAGIGFLKFSPELTRIVSVLFLILFTWRFMVFLSRFLITVLDAMLSHTSDYMGVRAVAPIITFVVWVIGISFLLDNFGLKISSIMAGLGIMGIAVGLASQAILGDFFGYLVILLDRPFRVGDFVNVGASGGTIERVGFKNTKLRMVTGELIAVPNGDMTKLALTNSSMTGERGQAFQFGIAYETPLEKVKAVPAMVEEIMCQVAPNATLARVHFMRFGDFSLIFEAFFSVPTNARIDVLNAQHAVNIAIMERFAAEGIRFAYPSGILYMGNEVKIGGVGGSNVLSGIDR